MTGYVLLQHGSGDHYCEWLMLIDGWRVRGGLLPTGSSSDRQLLSILLSKLSVACTCMDHGIKLENMAAAFSMVSARARPFWRETLLTQKASRPCQWFSIELGVAFSWWPSSLWKQKLRNVKVHVFLSWPFDCTGIHFFLWVALSVT